MPAFIPREVPPDLYIFSSWHFVRAWREAYVADDVWKQLNDAHSVAELKYHSDNPNKNHVPIHETVRKVFRLKPYEDHSPFWEPTPEFIGQTLKGFLDFYFKTRPHLLESIAEKQADKSVESEIDNSQKDANIATSEVKQEQPDIPPTPPAPKGDVKTQGKPKLGRPKQLK